MDDSNRVEGSSIDRRRRKVLGSVAAFSITSVAGCFSGSSFSPSTAESPGSPSTAANDSQPIVEDFESGTYTGTFTDYPQANAVPARVTTEFAHTGQRSLLLESWPGTETTARVRQTRPIRAPVEVSIWVMKVADTGSENAISLCLRDTDSHHRIRLFDSNYYGGVCARIEDVTERNSEVVQISSTLSERTWRQFLVRVESDGSITCGVGEQTIELMGASGWQDRILVPALWTNAWGNGDTITSAYDGYAVTSLTG